LSACSSLQCLPQSFSDLRLEAFAFEGLAAELPAGWQEMYSQVSMKIPWSA
jgi:hypothetical protein